MNPLALTISPTPEIMIHGGVPCRLWIGTNADGAKVKCLVALVAVDGRADQRPFVQSLVELPPPADFLLPDPSAGSTGHV